jgi:hypothetical protein
MLNRPCEASIKFSNLLSALGIDVLSRRISLA